MGVGGLDSPAKRGKMVSQGNEKDGQGGRGVSGRTLFLTSNRAFRGKWREEGRRREEQKAGKKWWGDGERR